jgi:hypothetical protein
MSLQPIVQIGGRLLVAIFRAADQYWEHPLPTPEELERERKMEQARRAVAAQEEERERREKPWREKRNSISNIILLAAILSFPIGCLLGAIFPEVVLYAVLLAVVLSVVALIVRSLTP